ncbi:MAG: hypothetical protein V4493_09680 [Pseudomonadota bacterium]
MDIRLIRIANIQHLAEKYSRERIAECDEKWTTNYVNQLYGGFGSFGAATARKIEKGLHLTHGWMDLLHPDVRYGSSETQPTDTVDKAQLLRLWEKMTADEKAKLLKIGAALVDE